MPWISRARYNELIALEYAVEVLSHKPKARDDYFETLRKLKESVR